MIPFRTQTLILAILASVATHAHAALSVQDYLEQVKGGHAGYKGATIQSEGAKLRAEEATILLAPTLVGSFQYQTDGRFMQGMLTYDKLNTGAYSLGVSKATSFGLAAKFSYTFSSVSYDNPVLPTISIPGLPSGSLFSFDTTYYEAKPMLEISQSLWSNGFGRQTRANIEVSEAQALAESHISRFQTRSMLVQAEAAYWRLVMARQATAIQKDALERARKIQDWSFRRSKLNLADPSDAMQADALVELRGLELQATLDEERAASRAFNSLRGEDSERVTDELLKIESSTIDALRAPERGAGALREDVQAAREQSRAADAAARISLERDSPTVDIFASAALNGRDTAAGTALSNSFKTSRPTYAGGLRLSIPLDIGTVSDSREGWRQAQRAAELSFQRKIFEQEQDWKDLTEKLAEARKRLELARKLEKIQAAKVTHERERLQRGRTTTYQVLMFEQDYESAQLSRLRGEAGVLSLIAQMKLFESTATTGATQ